MPRVWCYDFPWREILLRGWSLTQWFSWPGSWPLLSLPLLGTRQRPMCLLHHHSPDSINSLDKLMPPLYIEIRERFWNSTEMTGEHKN